MPVHSKKQLKAVKKSAKEAKKKLKKARQKAENSQMKAMILIVTGLLVTGVFALPTLIILVAGGLPTIVSFVTDSGQRKSRTISVGALNLAACTLYLLELWSHGNPIGHATSLIARPDAMVVMYAGAAVGYCIDWMLSSTISKVLLMQAKGRIKEIDKRQEELKKRWEGIE